MYIRYLAGTAMNVKLIDGTPFGCVVLAWSRELGRPSIGCILLSTRARSAAQRAAELYPSAPRSSCRDVDQVADRIAAFLDGEEVEFSLDLLALNPCGPFHQRVLRATHGISRGHVATYGGIAAHVDTPGAARAVGNAMATNPFPLIIPCHRVIRADRTLGSYGGGIEMKHALLAREGVIPDARGKVSESQLEFRS